MKKFRVTFGVNVPAYGSIIVDAVDEQHAREIAMRHHETGEKTDDEWESKIWQDSGKLDPLWSEAEDFRLLHTTEEK